MKTREDHLRSLQTELDQTRLDHTKDRNEQDSRNEARIRTMTFACEGQVSNAHLRTETLEKTLAEMRAANYEKPRTKAPSYASHDTQQYDIFGADGAYRRRRPGRRSLRRRLD